MLRRVIIYEQLSSIVIYLAMVEEAVSYYRFLLFNCSQVPLSSVMCICLIVAFLVSWVRIYDLWLIRDILYLDSLISFQVVLEHCSSEVFVHVSATRCWELVRERVNQEIAKQHKLGRTNLPPLQPPGSLDGLEMFGFTSPAIVQVNHYLGQELYFLSCKLYIIMVESLPKIYGQFNYV